MKALEFEKPLVDLMLQLETLRAKFVDKAVGGGDEITRLEAKSMTPKNGSTEK